MTPACCPCPDCTEPLFLSRAHQSGTLARCCACRRWQTITRRGDGTLALEARTDVIPDLSGNGAHLTLGAVTALEDAR